MSLYIPWSGEDHAALQREFLAREVQRCFACHDRIASFEIAITWRGTSEIWLHPKCAQSFIIRLGRDVWEWECKTKEKLQSLEI